MAMNVNDIVSKSRDGVCLSKDDLSFALSFHPHSPEAMMLMAEATRISRSASQGMAEVHAQLALNLAPCPGNCVFCSFAANNGVFTKETRVSLEDAVSMALQFEGDGANLFWAEAGANPCDTKERTEEGRGGTVAHCRKLFAEADWRILEGPSLYYRI